MEALIIVWIICAIIGAVMAGHRNRSTALWAIVCAITGLLGILALAIAGTKKD